ncbi:MAG TPA: hypothetical protein EYN18_04435, partial [Nitrospirales bacterium]|nr:hypothetical protein [Nitrospirales bacterium]
NAGMEDILSQAGGLNPNTPVTITQDECSEYGGTWSYGKKTTLEGHDDWDYIQNSKLGRLVIAERAEPSSVLLHPVPSERIEFGTILKTDEHGQTTVTVTMPWTERFWRLSDVTFKITVDDTVLENRPLVKFVLPKCDLTKSPGDENRSDTDKDGICDRWEYRKGVDWDCYTNDLEGNDDDCDGVIDLALPEADPRHKNISLEMDRLPGIAVPNLQPVIDAFADPNNGVLNPDGTNGIILTIEPGEEITTINGETVYRGHVFDVRCDEDNLNNDFTSGPDSRLPSEQGTQYPNPWNGFKGSICITDKHPHGDTAMVPLIKHGYPAGSPRLTPSVTSCNSVPNRGWFGTAEQRDAANCEKIMMAKKHVFRYAVLGWDICAYKYGLSECGITGIAEVGGDDFVVALGALDHPVDGDDPLVGENRAKAYNSTFMHELGHNLGLRHGGHDDINFKPNYISSMNYSFNPFWSPEMPLTYSNREFSVLDETAFNEAHGIGGTAVEAQQLPTVRFFSDGEFIVTDSRVNEPVDWNQNQSATNEGVEIDINNDGYCSLPTTPSLSCPNDDAPLDGDELLCSERTAWLEAVKPWTAWVDGANDETHLAAEGWGLLRKPIEIAEACIPLIRSDLNNVTEFCRAQIRPIKFKSNKTTLGYCATYCANEEPFPHVGSCCKDKITAALGWGADPQLDIMNLVECVILVRTHPDNPQNAGMEDILSQAGGLNPNTPVTITQDECSEYG